MKDLQQAEVVNLVKASDIIPEPIDWLWEGWLAAGKMHILAGKPGEGKTTICLSLAATLSSGGTWPDSSKAEAGNVIIWSGEDDPKDTLVPRLMASGADCNRIHFISGIQKGKEGRPFDPATDIEPLQRKLAEVGNVRLLIIDPIVSAIQGDSHKNAEVRRGLQPLVDLSESLRCALLGVTHFSKNTKGSDPAERIIGSVAFTAQARIVLAVGKRKNEDGCIEHILCRAKSNIGVDSGGFKYEIQQSSLATNSNISTSTIQWCGEVRGSARELLADAEEGTEESLSELQKAKNFLVEILSDGELPSKEISERAKECSISDRTLQRAKDKLGIRPKKKGVIWYMVLPEQESQINSSVPAKDLATLATLEERPVNADVVATLPTMPNEKQAQLEAEWRSNIRQKLNKIVAKGREDLKLSS